MDNLNFNFSDRFLFEAKRLGECLEVNDTQFLLRPIPYKNLAFMVMAQPDNKILLVELHAKREDEYGDLKTGEVLMGLTEQEALQHIKIAVAVYDM